MGITPNKKKGVGSERPMRSLRMFLAARSEGVIGQSYAGTVPWTTKNVHELAAEFNRFKLLLDRSTIPREKPQTAFSVVLMPIHSWVLCRAGCAWPSNAVRTRILIKSFHIFFE